ncbi:MAG: apolipoprotein N-acyltransferase [Planctomycetota bacterium]
MIRYLKSIWQKVRGLAKEAWQLRFLSLLAGLTGPCLFLVCTPHDYHTLHWVSFLPLFFACQQSSWKQNFYLGWCGGLASNCLIFSWIFLTITSYGQLPALLTYPVGALALLAMASWGAVLYGFLGVLLPLTRRHFPKLWILLVPSAFSFLEFYFPNIFPYFQGCGQFTNLPLLQLASVTGVTGITFLVLEGNCILFEGILQIRKKNWKWIGFILIGWILPLFLVMQWGKQRVQNYDDALKQTPHIKVAMVQTGWTIQKAFETRLGETLRFYQTQSSIALKNGAKLIIWPESSMSVNTRSPIFQQLHDFLLQWVQKEQFQLIYGGNASSQNADFLNTAYYINPQGTQKNYSKMTLVPFGEYTPFVSLIPALKGKLSRGVQLAAGEKRELFQLDYGKNQTFPFAMAICYEAIFHRKIWQCVQDGARLIVNVTVDAWFLGTNEHTQHLMLASIGTVQLGVGLLRSVDSGITAYIDPVGRIHNPTPILKQALWEGEVPLGDLDTPIRRYGFWFPWLCFMLSVIAFLYRYFTLKYTKSGSK